MKKEQNAQPLDNSGNAAKPIVGRSLPPDGFLKQLKRMRSWVASSKEITDAEYDLCRRAFNELTTIFREVQNRRQ